MAGGNKLQVSIYPCIGVSSNGSVLGNRQPKYWNFSFSISLSGEYSGLISFRIDWFDLLASKGLSRVFSNINSSILRLFYFTDFTSIHDYWKNHGLIIQIFAGKVMSLLFNLLSRFVIVFCPRSKCLLISSEKAQWKSWLKTQHSKN